MPVVTVKKPIHKLLLIDKLNEFLLQYVVFCSLMFLDDYYFDVHDGNL